MLLQAVVSGIAAGCLYALVAQGFYMTFIATEKLNFGQGDHLMMGAMVGLHLVVTWNLPYGVALLAAVVVAGLLGWAMERWTIRPLSRAVAMGWVVTTLSAGMILQNLAQLAWGRSPRAFPSPLGEEPIQLFGTGLLPQELFVVPVSLLVMAGLFFWLRRSVLGKALRAVAFSADTASLMGISVRRLVVLAFVLSSSLAGMAGVLMAPIHHVQPHMGFAVAIKAFAAAIIGGIENPGGILVGGLLLGLSEFLLRTVTSQFADALIFSAIIVLMAFKPNGIFATAQGRRV